MESTINIQQLNTTFGIDNKIEFVKGKNDLPFIKINNNKASALISIYAGQVLSFQPVNEAEDFFFISDNAYFQPGKAIKGGIPICWPWFGADPTDPENPDHGFARNNFWSVSSASELLNGDTQIKLEFTDSDQSKKIWPHSFYLSLTITISDSLTLDLYTRNTSKHSFSITEALHTYFNVGDASHVQVLGLEHTEYIDKTDNYIKACQIGAITLSEETDHIHTDIKHDITIKDPALNRKIRISSSGNKNVVVWNPWAKGSESIQDLDKNDYKHFICVEIANAATGIVEIQPEADYTLTTNYSVTRD